MPYLLNKAISKNSLLRTADSTGIPSWNPIPLQEYIQSREGKIWRRRDTLWVLQRAEEIDGLIKQLMRSAGLTIQSNRKP
jgi:hypothetical protein